MIFCMEVVSQSASSMLCGASFDGEAAILGLFKARLHLKSWKPPVFESSSPTGLRQDAH